VLARLAADFLMILLGRQQTFLSVASSGGLRNAPKYLVTFFLARGQPKDAA